MPEISAIVDAASQHFNVAAADLLGRRRNAKLVNARHVSIYLAMRQLDTTQDQVGSYFNVDQTTICRVVHKINRRRARDKGLLQSIQILEAILRGSDVLVIPNQGIVVRTPERFISAEEMEGLLTKVRK